MYIIYNMYYNIYIYIYYIHTYIYYTYIYILYIHIYIYYTYIYIYITLYYIHCCSVCNRKSVNLKLLTKPPADSPFWEDETDPRRLSSRSKRMGSNPRLVSSTIRKAFWMVSCQMLRDGMGWTSFLLDLAKLFFHHLLPKHEHLPIFKQLQELRLAGRSYELGAESYSFLWSSFFVLCSLMLVRWHVHGTSRPQRFFQWP